MLGIGTKIVSQDFSKGAGKFLGTKNSEKRSKKFRKVKDLGSRDTVLEIGTKIGTLSKLQV